MAKSIFRDVPDARRRIMKSIKSKDTKPELLVRSYLHSKGYRFRVHVQGLPGKPDVVFTAKRKVLDIRGCFWHGHGCSAYHGLPKSRTNYWEPKISRNVERDKENFHALIRSGWAVHIIWECELKRTFTSVADQMLEFLGPSRT